MTGGQKLVQQRGKEETPCLELGRRVTGLKEQISRSLKCTEKLKVCLETSVLETKQSVKMGAGEIAQR